MSLVEDVLKLKLPVDAWALSLSDIHLHKNRTEASAWVEAEITQRIAVHPEGPGVIVLNGDIIELWAGEQPNIAAALQAHPKFTKAVQKFSNHEDRQVVFVVGNHDGEVGWDESDQKLIQKELSAKLCFQLQLDCAGKVIIFEHGHQFDPDNCFEDPRDQHDHPMGQYVVQKILPLAKKTKSDVFDDIDTLAEPHRFPVFAFSRVFYRVIGSNIGWLILPFVVALVYRFLIVGGFYFLQHSASQRIIDFLVVTDVIIILDGIIVLIVGFVILRHFWKLSSSLVDERGGSDHNYDTREYTKKLTKQDQVIGGVFGHTHRPEVTSLEHGFYANSGSGTKTTRAYPAHFGLPRVYIPTQQLSWLEFDVSSSGIRVSLYDGSRKAGGGKRAERLMLKKPMVYTEVKMINQIEV